MRHVIDVSDDIAIVFSFGECNFDEVLDSLAGAEWVDIATYNLSRRDERLHELISDKCKGVPVRLVTKIPNWFRWYKEGAAQSFRDLFAIYHKRLDPENYHCVLEAVFNVHNHAKLILTDRIAYVGSANYSPESSSNFECGVLFRSAEVIYRIRSEIFERLLSESRPRDVSEIGKAREFFEQLERDLGQHIAALDDGFVGPLDDYAGTMWVRWQDAEVPTEYLESIVEYLNRIDSDLDEIREHAHLGDVPDAHLDQLLRNIRELVEDSESPLVVLAEFDYNEALDRYMQKYSEGAYAYDVDACSASANEDADRENKEKIEAAVAAHRELTDRFRQLQDYIAQILRKLGRLAKTTWGIDNTLD